MLRRALALAFTLTACNSAEDEVDVVPPTLDASAPPTAIPSDALVVHNDTGAPVPLAVRDIDRLALDRRVVDATFALPMGPAGTLPDERVVVDQHQPRSLRLGIVHIVDYSAQSTQSAFGTFVGLEGGPSFLALGSGRLRVRTAGGAPTLEADDPRVVTMLPVERQTPACPDGLTGKPLEGLPTNGAVTLARPVDSVTRDAAGCREFHSDLVPLVRACLADEAYPFEAADVLTMNAALHIIPGVRQGVRIENEKGAALDLVYASMPPRKSTSIIDELGVSVDVDASCATVRPPCGDVEVPLSITVTFGATTVPKAKLGVPIASAAKPNVTAYVLAGRARPIGLEACAARPPDQFFAPAEVSIAIITRPSP